MHHRFPNIQLASDRPASMTHYGATTIVADTSTRDFSSITFIGQFGCCRMMSDCKVYYFDRTFLSPLLQGLHTVETQKFPLTWLASKHAV